MRVRSAFTMIELMVVCSIMAMVLVPIYKIMSHGSKSAIKGVQRNNIIMHGQQILSTIKSDLSESGFLLVDGATHNIYNVATQTADVAGNIKISLYSFNGGNYESQVIPTSSGAESHRRLNKIVYELISKPGSFFKVLERTVYLHPSHPGFKAEGHKQILSNHVNYFDIKPDPVSSKGYTRSFFRVSLQLFDQDGTSATAPDPAKMFIAEFTDTVNPIILNSISTNPGLNRNWYTDPSDSK